MPGSQTVIYTDNAKEQPRKIWIRARPTSLWRLVQWLGPLIMFRLGGLVSFRLDFKLLSGDVAAVGGEVGDLRLELWVGDKLIRRERIEYPFPRKGNNTYKKTDGLFLNGLGHGELKVEGTGIYTFDVWEPAYSVVNWAFVILAGVLGGLVGYLLSG